MPFGKQVDFRSLLLGSPAVAKTGKKRKNEAKRKYTAKTADRHELYQLSVQSTEHELKFIEKAFKRHRSGSPTTLREDFCGTALFSCAWVLSSDDRQAVGVDISRETLDWAREHNVQPIGNAAKRLTLLEDDVRTVRPGKFDVINAMNFSYWIFDTRKGLREYFERVHAALQKGGMFVLDAYGGWESHQPMKEPRRIDAGFTYVWEQGSFDPITSLVVNHIHFEFKDGSRIKRAFTYEWRFWSLPEIRELLLEAGFSEVVVYWDQSEDEDKEKYRPSETAENQPGWLAYLVALP